MKNICKKTAAGCSESKINDLFYTVKTESGLEVEFCDKGAAIYSIKYNDTYVTYGTKDKELFVNDNYHYGKIIGRIAGRVKDGKFKIGDKEYNLELNEIKHDEHNNKNNTLHSGTNSLHTKVFRREAKELSDRYTVTYNYVSPAGESGFPETLNICVTYSVYKNTPKLDTNIYAIPSGITPINLTSHTYFRLGNSGTIKQHFLTIPTDSIGKFNFVDKNQIVVGKINVDDSSVTKGDVIPFDFRTTKLIGQDILTAKQIDDCSNGYDHMWCTSDGSVLSTNECPLILENKETGIKMEIVTDANASFIYANCWPKANIEILPSGLDVENGGIAIEPQHYWTFKDDGQIDSNILFSPSKPFSMNISYKWSNN